MVPSLSFSPSSSQSVALASSIPGFNVDRVDRLQRVDTGAVVVTDVTIETRFVISASSTALKSTCPRCQQSSTCVHSSYARSPRDLPWSDQSVVLKLRVRRFFCRNPNCSQKTFAERLPELLPVRAQRTTRLTNALRAVGMALGGEPGARLAGHLHMPTSGDTLLRIIRQIQTTLLSLPSLPACNSSTPRVLGVDDWALRRGHVYGTILVDLERGRPIDLLPDRRAETLADWLRCHPGVEIITRDRSVEYARGATEGAPQAVQVADRWHILKNLREVLERILDRLRPELHERIRSGYTPIERELALALGSAALEPRRSANEEAAKIGHRLRRLVRYDEVLRLHEQGISILQIAKRLGMSRTTVRRFINTPAFPERVPTSSRRSILDSYEGYLQERWEAGCHNGMQLLREIQALGYPGTRKPVAEWAQRRREEPDPNTPKRYLERISASAPSAAAVLDRNNNLNQESTTKGRETRHGPRLGSSRQLVWLLLRKHDRLDIEQQKLLDQLREEPEVGEAYELGQRFLAIVQQRKAEELDGWLDDCLISKVSNLRAFAQGLDGDYQAVKAAVSFDWSNGPVEGHVNRLKLLKRQSYGRASFELLKQRVLYST